MEEFTKFCRENVYTNGVFDIDKWGKLDIYKKVCQIISDKDREIHEAYERGEQEGYESGYEHGYDEGYNDGLNDK